MAKHARRGTPNPLLRQAREELGLTQDELADQLIQLGAKGVTGGSVSKWERGVCRPNSFHRRLLCGFFDATPEQLGFHRGRRNGGLDTEAEEAIRAVLLEPARATVKLSWLVWYGNADTSVVHRVASLTATLADLADRYQGALRSSILELMAYGHEMIGKVAFDQLDYPTAYRHFLDMQRLGEELADARIIGLSAIHQGDLLRRRGQYDLAVQRLESTASHTADVAPTIEGLRQQTLARAHAEQGHREDFVRTIEAAQASAAELQGSEEDWGNEFSAIAVLHERAHGHTLLWEPEKALDIYEGSESRLQIAALRDLGSFTILKAQAHAYAGNVDVGVELAIEGLRFARRYDSPRHVSRVERMYDRLSATPIGSSARMRDLAEALRVA